MAICQLAKVCSTKNDLLHIAEELFVKNGYTKTSIEDILKRAKISKGGFYHHFESKGDVLHALIDREIHLVTQEVEKIVRNNQLSALEKMEQYSLRAWALLKPKGKLFLEIFHQAKDPFINEEIFNELRSHILPLLVKIVEQGIREGTMTVKYPYETVDSLMMIREGLVRVMPEIHQNQQKMLRYFMADKEIVCRTLGIKGDFISKQLESILSAHLKLNKVK
ncbi:MAG: TetR/AcrR family transcriptional regulator [Patescibacteria group bacterium]